MDQKMRSSLTEKESGDTNVNNLKGLKDLFWTRPTRYTLKFRILQQLSVVLLYLAVWLLAVVFLRTYVLNLSADDSAIPDCPGYFSIRGWFYHAIWKCAKHHTTTDSFSDANMT